MNTMRDILKYFQLQRSSYHLVELSVGREGPIAPLTKVKGRLLIQDRIYFLGDGHPIYVFYNKEPETLDHL